MRSSKQKLKSHLSDVVAPKGTYEHFKGKPTVLKVSHGDFGSKYHPLDGWMKAHNRAVNKRHQRYLMENWNEELSGLITLVVSEDGSKIYIIDGQHRVAACSAMDEPQVLLARVYLFNEIPMDVNLWVQELNAGQKRFRLDDYLATHQSYSLWPDVFEEEGITPKFSSTFAAPQWATILRGAHYGLILRDKGQLIHPRRLRLRDAVIFWEIEDTDTIRRVAKFNKWWRPFVTTARNYRVGGMQAAAVMGLAFVVYEENKGKAALDKAKERLLTWPSVTKIKLYQSAREEYLAILQEALIFGMNRGARSSSQLLTLFGATGRN